jgi:hypothetical protein
MTQPTDGLTDAELGGLLTQTFTAHEALADPDRAVAIALSPGRPRQVGRVVLAAAAAVAVVAGGTTYAASRGSNSASGPPYQGLPAAKHVPALPPLQTDKANRLKAVAAALAAISRVPAYPGAHETNAAGVPQLGDNTLSSAQPTGHTEVKSRFWTVAGVAPKAVARWYLSHTAGGFRAEPGVGGQGDGTTWIDEVYWDPSRTSTSQAGTWAEIQTTRTAAGVGVRVTVSSVWLPARPLASYVQDVSSIDVQSTHDHLGQHPRSKERTFTVSSSGRVLRAAAAFDALPGMTPMILSCPMMIDTWTDRIVFHTATGDVTAVEHTSSCGFGMSVSRDGRLVNPQLGAPAPLLAVLGLAH